MSSVDSQRIARALEYLSVNYKQQPELQDLASFLQLSPSYCQKLFKRWAGLSPKRFLQFLTVEEAKKRLKASKSLLQTSLDLGLSGPSRLHDHFIQLEAMTPGDYKNQGQDLRISWSFQDSPFGRAFLAFTERGVCWLAFQTTQTDKALLEEMKSFWSLSQFEEDEDQGQALAERIFARFEADTKATEKPLSVLVKGSNFELQVWRALINIPFGEVRSYGQIADAVGSPKAARAVGSACGRNSVSVLIPCHRVIRSSGYFHNYRWGPEKKRALLATEWARSA